MITPVVTELSRLSAHTAWHGVGPPIVLTPEIPRPDRSATPRGPELRR
jgi:hypothetical protein